MSDCKSCKGTFKDEIKMMHDQDECSLAMKEKPIGKFSLNGGLGTRGQMLGYSPLSGKVYLGKPKKNKPNEWAGKKVDITDNFMDVMLQKFEPNTETKITRSDDKGKSEKIVITVKRIPRA